MTSRIISGSYPSGLYVSHNYTDATITASGYVGGSGLNTGSLITITNYGRVDAQIVGEARGVYLAYGGEVYNHASIYGYFGVLSSSYNTSGVRAGTVVNSGSIGGDADGVVLFFGGAVQNFGEITGGRYGVFISGAAGTVANLGTISAAYKGPGKSVHFYGVSLTDGRLTNGSNLDTAALVQGYNGVAVGSGGTVVNYGVIHGAGPVSGVYGAVFSDGGALVNGSTTDSVALVEGYQGVVIQAAAGVVSNFGTIRTLGGSLDVDLQFGGRVTNGALSDQNALIEGINGVVWGGPTTLVNFATIEALQGSGAFSAGDGEVFNGAATDHDALINAYSGIEILGAAVVSNYGAIRSSGAAQAGVLIGAGAVTNGDGADTIAIIIGDAGVQVVGGGTVRNLATITGLGAAGAYLQDGGLVINGEGLDRSALIQGTDGVEVAAAAGAVSNFATILGDDPFGVGVDLEAGGSLTNGAANDRAAFIGGNTGVALDGVGASANYGVIWGAGEGGSEGAYLGGGASLTNGAAAHAGAMVYGYLGVALGVGANTLTNFGTVLGEGGVAVTLTSASDVLTVEAGSVFEGAIDGGGGVLDLASGAGTLTGLLSAGGNVTVSGSMATTTFTGFGAVEVGPAASFTLFGGGAIAGGQALIVEGTATTSGVLTIAGALTTGGTLAGTGTLAMTGGMSTFGAGTALTIAKVAESGSATIAAFETRLTYAGVWTQTAGTVSASTGERVNFTGKGDSFAGTLSGAGTIAFIGGADTLTGATLSAKSVRINGPAVNLAGTIDLATSLTATTGHLIIAAGGATLFGGGTLFLTNRATNAVVGASGAATLTNDDKIKGAGQLGDGEMILHNHAGALIEAKGGLALIVDTGVSTIINAGTIQSAGAGGLTISSPLDNTGVLLASQGTLEVAGAVKGGGAVEVDGGAAEFTGAFAQKVSFTGASGVLELSGAYSGDVSGFSKTGGTSIDLLNVAFAGDATGVYSGTATSGVLTVTEGTSVAKIHLVGDYLGSTFALSAGPGGVGTSIVDPSSATHPFIAAMAGFQAGGVGLTHAFPDAWRPPPGLATPRMQLA